MLELLRDPAYRHVLLNHVPIIGLFMAFVVLSAGLATRQASLLFTGLALVALTAGTSLPVARFGDAAYPAIYDTLDSYGRDWLDYHAELAEAWLPLLYANAVLALLALIACALRPRLLRCACAVVALVTLAGLVGAGVVARSGGKIQHPEFRLGNPPVLSFGGQR